jgi:hypothetical protein
VKHFRLALGLVAALALSGCNTLDKVSAFANKYGPIIGKDIIQIGNIIVQAECSPTLAPASQSASNTLTIVAPDGQRANTVKSYLAKNVSITQELCPLYASIKAQVGSVPNVTPSQVIAIPAGS